MATKEFPNHTKFRTGLQRIIEESVAETLSETDREIAATWRGELQRRRRQSTLAEIAGRGSDRHGRPKRPS